MEVEIKIDNNYTEPKIVILTDKITQEISVVMKKLSENSFQIFVGSKDGELHVLEQNDLIRIYANEGKVFAVTVHGEYTIRLRLYELEERLEKNKFVRISNSEIINLKKVKKFDLSFVGTICVRFSDGSVTYVSRRYVKKIKQILGI